MNKSQITSSLYNLRKYLSDKNSEITLTALEEEVLDILPKYLGSIMPPDEGRTKEYQRCIDDLVKNFKQDLRLYRCTYCKQKAIYEYVKDFRACEEHKTDPRFFKDIEWRVQRDMEKTIATAQYNHIFAQLNEQS